MRQGAVVRVPLQIRENRQGRQGADPATDVRGRCGTDFALGGVVQNSTLRFVAALLGPSLVLSAIVPSLAWAQAAPDSENAAANVSNDAETSPGPDAPAVTGRPTEPQPTASPLPATRPAPTIPAAQSAAAPQSQPLTLTVERALARLDTDNPDLLASRARAAQAAARVRQAGAGLRPKLIATGSYVRNNKEVSVGLGALSSVFPGAPSMPNVVIQPLDAWTATGMLKVPLFAPTAWYDVDTAQAAAEASDATTEVAKQRARAGLLQLVYGTRALEEVVSAAERAIELASRQVTSAERRVAAGTAAPLDVLRAKADLVQRESDLANAKSDLERAQLSIGVLLGEAVPVHVAAPEVDQQAKPTPADVQAAQQRRSEFEVIDAQTRAGEAMLNSAKARMWPELSATGAVFASDEPYPTGDKTGWRVSVDLTIPLYDGGFRYGKREEAEATLQLARSEAQKQRLAVRQEVTLAEGDVSLAAERLRLAETKVALAQDAAASAERAFNVGVVSSLDVLDANDRLFQAEVALAAERARAARANIELRRALGTL